MKPLEFLNQFAALSGGCGPDERFIFCGFPGNPNDLEDANWKPRVWRPEHEVLPINPLRTNGYLAISTFGRDGNGRFRRRAEQFVSGRCMMIDDVGDGDAPANRVDRSLVRHVMPTYRIETSPENEQWLYVFREPVKDQQLLRALIEAFVDQHLIDGRDPGMKGVSRVFRLPGFINGKPTYRGWRCRLLESNTTALYTIEELRMAFKLTLRIVNINRKPVYDRTIAERRAMFDVYKAALKDWDMLRRSHPDGRGWTDIVCPWADEHSAQLMIGSAIAEPSAENDWWGAFQCHHGHCEHRTWADFTDWVAHESAEQLLEVS